MSDRSQGDGWWVASDGRWYPPEQHPDYVPSSPPPPASPPPDLAPPRADQPPPGSPGHPTSAPPVVGASPFAGKSRSQLVVLGCALAIAIGAFLPWAKITFIFGTFEVSGIDADDGWFFLAGAAVLAALAWWREPRVPVLVVAVLGVVGFIVERQDIGSGNDAFEISLGIGLWITLLASLVAGAAAVNNLTAPAAGADAPTGAGLEPVVPRYWWGLAICVVLLVGAIVAGTDDHADELEAGFGDTDALDEGFGFTENKDADPPPPLELEVTEVGLSSYTDYDDSPTGTAGAAIVNNGDEDVAYVEVTFTFLDAAEKPVATESTYIDAVEAGGTTYAVVEGIELQRDAVAVEVNVVDDEDREFYSFTPTVRPVDDITVTEEEYGGWSVTGTASNPGTASVDDLVVRCVLRRGGSIVGGATGYLDTIPAGGSIAWDVTVSADIAIDGADCIAAKSE